jgi:hypothetical protein
LCDDINHYLFRRTPFRHALLINISFQMARHEDSGGVSALVRHTAGMAELAINAGHPDRKHNEYLPYPDNNFNEPVDERFQRG